MNIEQLNADFAIADQLIFVEGKGGQPCIHVSNEQAEALISVYAGQVLSFRAKDAAELLFVSENAYFETGKATKGGIPICWPWFGPDPEEKGRPAHGFVRNRMWNVVATLTAADGATQVTLGLESTPETLAIWPHAFKLLLEITVGAALKLALVTRNTGDQAFSITQALHTYFAVGDIAQTKVLGLEGKQYIDKVGCSAIKQQDGAVTVSSEVDRIYTDVPAALTIVDEAMPRKIHIRSSGNNTTVVWNPWVEISAKMADLHDDDYRKFVCVETTNAADDVVEILPGGEFRLEVKYKV